MSESRDSSESDPYVAVQAAEPIPKRFWWLKRLLIAAGILVVALACLRWWWGFEAHRRLQAQIEQYRQAGQPVYASEFDAELDAVPDEENAAVLYEQAIGAITFATESGVRYEDFRDERTTFDDNMPAATELIKSNAPVLGLVRQARWRPQVAWSQRLEGLFTNFNIGMGSGQRSLAKLLRFSASYHYRTGNHAEAIETLGDFLAFSEAVDSHPTIIASLIAWACDGLAITFIEEAGAKLNIADNQVDLGQGQAAGRGQVLELVRTLLDDERSRKALVRMFYGERAWPLDMLDSISRSRMFGTPLPPPTVWSRATDFLQRPLLELDVMRTMKHSTLGADAAAEASWPLGAKRVPIKANAPCLIHELSRPLSEIMLGATAICVRMYFKSLAKRRMGATALAIRVYVIDNGHRPENLAQLIPDYLPAVPLDPFSAEGAPIRYKPDQQPPILYSVGRDGTDSGGVMTFRPDGRLDRDKSDLLFYLDGKIVEDEDADPEGSSEAGQDDKDGKDDERQADENQSGKSEP